MKIFYRYWFPVLLVMGGIGYFSLFDKPTGLDGYKHQDKVSHFVAYFVLGFSVMRAWGVSKGVYCRRLWSEIAVSVAIAGGYGVLLEMCQLYCNRSCELGDMVANFSGAFVGALLYHLGLGLVPKDVHQCPMTCNRP